MGFFQAGAGHPEYCKMRDDPSAKESAAWFEELWRFYDAYNPGQEFLEHARQNLESAWWQMYVAYCFAQHGHALVRPRPFGPDVRVVSPQKFWVEAVCPEPGTGEDAAVRRYVDPNRFTLDRRAMVLRYTSALCAKRDQRERQVKGGAVAPGDPYVVAVGGSRIADADLVKDVPEIVKAVLGIGDLVLVVPVDGQTPHTQLTPRPSVANKNQAEVATAGFLTTEFTGISGVLFCGRLPWSRPTSPGDDMIYVQNPMAQSLVDPDRIHFGRGYRVTPRDTAFAIEICDYRK